MNGIFSTIDRLFPWSHFNLRLRVQRMTHSYPTVKIIASSITPRKDQLNTAVKRANELIHNELKKDQMKDIILIDNSNLDKQELLFDAKHLNRKNGVKILASNIKRTNTTLTSWNQVQAAI